MLRNIGILAHIDAGKTTVTERMLYYSGEVSHIGEVHDGDTVMDYLDQERERGITINSASTSFEWRNHTLNLIDTPGHVDFTVEVERAVRALDGAVVLYDAVSGVQAQSETVWVQARRYGVPRIAFVNKMDRDGANMERVMDMIEDRFGVSTLCLQHPYFVPDDFGGQTFRGVIDLIRERVLVWDQSKESKTFEEHPLSFLPEEVASKAVLGRATLAEQLAGLDDQFFDVYIEADEAGKVEEIDEHYIRHAVRRVCINQDELAAVPVLCGSALKNTGVQTLLDAVLDYLPNPMESVGAMELAINNEELARAGGSKKKAAAKKKSNDSTALVFKVQHDPNRGALAYVRVYEGKMENKKQYHNVSLAHAAADGMVSLGTITGNAKNRRDAKSALPLRERVQGVLRAYANEFEQIEAISAGDIGILCGLKGVRTGDTLSSNAKRASLRGVDIPPPVFSAAIELESISDEPKLLESLEILLRDDPSLNVVQDDETGQLLLYGMGELHLDIAVTKLQRDFKVPCELGRVRVAYRETLRDAVEASGSYTQNQPSESARSSEDEDADGGDAAEQQRESAGNAGTTTVTLRVRPHPDGINAPVRLLPDPADSSAQESRIRFRTPGAGAESQWTLRVDQEKALRSGVIDTFQRGPLLGYPVQGVEVEIVENHCEANSSAPPPSLRAAATRASMAILNKAQAGLLEPVADVIIVVPDDDIGSVIGDLSSNERRGQIKDVQAETTSDSVVHMAKSSIHASVPLEGLIGYSTVLRSMTAGEGNFSLTVAGYTEVSETYASKIISHL
ncbi:Elongation factor G, mitochondrial [Hondaea fermentalgiana]|uniref:Elongation factor G, mitochondrial n=1 Tax=Hondaea fermentalgiana TaxID=2315210 RepID=A0A2R5GDH7_9STRA|nr:Elongation factor G, mitochondrial [Hondaea fermentalgiana]|eukprot:GBG29006.1 Elongation factor G, mitochondrial [Hondaea fermentalgiana]